MHRVVADTQPVPLLDNKCKDVWICKRKYVFIIIDLWVQDKTRKKTIYVNVILHLPCLGQPEQGEGLNVAGMGLIEQCMPPIYTPPPWRNIQQGLPLGPLYLLLLSLHRGPSLVVPLLMPCDCLVKMTFMVIYWWLKESCRKNNKSTTYTSRVMPALYTSTLNSITHR